MSLTEADKAYIQIKEKIITLEMPPGSVIRETKLMQELGMGRTPIREALMQLEADKLVIVAPRRGIFVTEISITDLQQLYEIRIELESLCACLATQRITPEQLAEMEALATEYRQNEIRDPRDLMAVDRRFHQLLAQATGNKFLSHECELFYNLSLRLWNFSLDRLKPRDLDVDTHVEILTAIKAGDSEQARLAMRRHIKEFQEVLKLRL